MAEVENSSCQTKTVPDSEESQPKELATVDNFHSKEDIIQSARLKRRQEKRELIKKLYKLWDMVKGSPVFRRSIIHHFGYKNYYYSRPPWNYIRKGLKELAIRRAAQLQLEQCRAPVQSNKELNYLQHVGKTINITLINNKILTGNVFTVDPEAKSYVLISKDTDGNLILQIIIGHAIVTVELAETNLDIPNFTKDELINLFSITK